jgi:signal transduction histidine kinase
MEFDFNLEDKKALILIVDDIPKNLQVLSNILNIEGYQISFASNGKQALSVVESTLPDLILLDVMMPEMDGYEFASKLKSDPRTKDIPIIFLTGKAEPEDIVKGFKHGAVDYVTKPFNSLELMTRVNTHLELKFAKDRMQSYNSKLKEYQEELKQVISSKDKFFSIIAHDLRGPFSGFIGLSEILNEEYENLEQEEIANIAKNMNKAAKRLFSFLENLLEWSSTQMGRMEYNPHNIDIFDIAEKNMQLLSNNAEEKDNELIIEIPKQTYAFADSNMVNTIFRNLISNAIKFTEKGKIRISHKMEGDLLVIEVSDNGVGMNEKIMDQLFRIENKSSSPGTRNESGSGLGLILCRELVQKNGGEINVSSKPGKGTTFEFTLPKAKM